MTPAEQQQKRALQQRLAEAEATIRALLAGQIDAVIEPATGSPVLLSRAQAELRESEAQYRQIVEATSDGIIKSDDLGRILFVNRRFAEILGHEPHAMIGRLIWDFMDPSVKAAATLAFEQGRHRTAALIDTNFRHAKGHDIAVNIAGSPLFDAEGRRVGHLGVVRDVTERNKLHSQLMVSDRMASVGTLAAGVAHEINNPLAAVIANIDYIAESVELLASGGSSGTPRSEAWLREEIRGPLEDAREASRQMRFIVRDLKIFSRSPSEATSGPVDVNATIASSLRMAWNEIRHRARLVKNLGVVPHVEGNEARLGQVFLNLVVNAAQALPEGHAEQHRIGVSSSVEDGRVVVAVSDTGPGIPPEIIGRIFDAFFTTKPVGVGTGLGLAICQRIVTDMHGELTVTSELGRGTTFRVVLPLAQDKASEVAPVAVVASPSKRGRILVVDDEELVARVVSRTLSKDHDVVSLVNARDALALCASERFDLILCDLMMPEMTGIDFYRELSRLVPEQAERIVFLTGGAFTPEARRFLTETPREHLEKPYDPGDLRAIVQRHLRA